MIDRRILRLGFEIDGELRVFDGLRFTASGTKFTDPTLNDASITVSGLSSETRQYLMRQSFGDVSRAAGVVGDKIGGARVVVEAGRESLGAFPLFVGDVYDAEAGVPPDPDVALKAKTNWRNNGRVSVVSGHTLRELAEFVAIENELTLLFEAKNRRLHGFRFSGGAAQSLQKMQQLGDLSVFVDNDKLIVKDADVPLRSRLRILNPTTGLVGVPRATDKGVVVRYLADAEAALGGVLRLESRARPELSGDYMIDELRWEVATHDDAFWYDATCRRIEFG